MKSTLNRPRRSAAGFSVPRIFNADSPFTKPNTDIQTFLSVCLLNWSHYDESEKEEIISKLPSAYRTVSYNADGSINCPLSPEFTKHDGIIRDQIARFKRDISDGFYTKTWQEKAKRAMIERADGKFDEYIANHTAEMFDVALNCDQEEDGEDGADAYESDGEYGPKKKARKSQSNKRDERAISRVMATLQDVEDAERICG